MIPSWFLLALMCCTVTGIQSILLLNAAKTGMSAKDLSNTMVWSQLPPLLMLWILGYAHVDLATAWIPALLVAIAFYISLLGLTSYVGGIYAYKAGGDLVIVYKIVSFSLIFPMVYSVLFLGEKLTRAKMIAVGLTG